MNENLFRDRLISYSKTLPETVSDDEREKVLLAYLDEMAEADIERMALPATAKLEADTEQLAHESLELQHKEEGASALEAARNALG